VPGCQVNYLTNLAIGSDLCRFLLSKAMHTIPMLILLACLAYMGCGGRLRKLSKHWQGDFNEHRRYLPHGIGTAASSDSLTRLELDVLKTLVGLFSVCHPAVGWQVQGHYQDGKPGQRLLARAAGRTSGLRATALDTEVSMEPDRGVASKYGGMVENAQLILGKVPWMESTYECLQKDRDHLILLERAYKDLDNATSYVQPRSRGQLRSAVEVAFLAHYGQKRRSGEPFVLHPIEVAKILSQSQMDIESVIAGILHDTVEDTDLSFDQISALFGPTISKIVEGETKVSKLPKMVRAQIDLEDKQLTKGSKEAEQAENLRSMFIAMADDWRVVAVKLADRLHNMRTLEHMPRHKQVAIASETLDILAPLAHRFGMYHYKTELSDLCFKYLFPDEFKKLSDYIASRESDLHDTIELANRKLQQILNDDQFLQESIESISVTGRIKSLYSTWKKMQSRNCSINEIKDLVAARVVLNKKEGEHLRSNGVSMEDTSLCYYVLSKVQLLWTPLPGTLKDYISQPKPNQYRSLHTTVVVGIQPLEVQIRTLDMHKEAEYGAAAHWQYKDSQDWSDNSSTALRWKQIILGIREQADCAQDFVQKVRDELKSTRVFVFTTGGQIHDLRRGATVEQFAEQQGVSVISFVTLVNGKKVHGATRLQNADIISFERLETWSDEEAMQENWKHAPIQQGATMSKTMPNWDRCAQCRPLPGEQLLGAVSDIGGKSDATLHRDGCECRLLQRQLAMHGRTQLRGPEAQEMLRNALDGFFDSGFDVEILVFCRDRRGILAQVCSEVGELAYITGCNSETLTPCQEAVLEFKLIVQDEQQLSRVMDRVKTLAGVVRVLRDNMEGMMLQSPSAFWANCHPLPPLEDD